MVLRRVFLCWTPTALTAAEPDGADRRPSRRMWRSDSTSGTTGRPKGCGARSRQSGQHGRDERVEHRHQRVRPQPAHPAAVPCERDHRERPRSARQRRLCDDRRQIRSRTFFDRLESTGATYFFGSPTIYTMLLGLPPEVQPDTSKVRFAVCRCGAGQRRTAGGLREALRFPAGRGLRLVRMHVRGHLQPRSTVSARSVRSVRRCPEWEIKIVDREDSRARWENLARSCCAAQISCAAT